MATKKKKQQTATSTKTANKTATSTKTANKTAKTAATKAAPKKLIRGGSARLTARDAEAGQPPAGKLDEKAVDAAVLGWRKKTVKSKDDYVPYAVATILKDLREMQQGAADLAAFKAIKAPISERHFTWLRLLGDALEQVGDDDIGAARKTLSREGEVAMGRVKEKRTALSRVALAGGVSSAVTNFKPRGDEPAAYLAAADRVVRQATRALPQFHDRQVAQRLIDDLRQATDTLRTVVFGKQDIGVDAASHGARRAGLRRLTYDALTTVGPWGIAAVGDDPAARVRYRLDNIFPGAPGQKSGGSVVDPAGDPAPAG